MGEGSPRSSNHAMSRFLRRRLKPPRAPGSFDITLFLGLVLGLRSSGSLTFNRELCIKMWGWERGLSRSVGVGEACAGEEEEEEGGGKTC